jgi:hypothetical protein
MKLRKSKEVQSHKIPQFLQKLAEKSGLTQDARKIWKRKEVGQ